MRAAVALVAVLACACAHWPWSRDYKRVEMHLVAEKGGFALPGWSENDAAFVESTVLFSGRDFASIAFGRGGDDKKTPALELRFKPEAAARFAEATKSFTGRRLAVVIGGKVAVAPKILHPIDGGFFEITGPSEAQLREMERLIKSR